MSEDKLSPPRPADQPEAAPQLAGLLIADSESDALEEQDEEQDEDEDEQDEDEADIEQPALHQAAIAGRVAVVEALLTAGVDVNMESDSGKTALHAAAKFGRTAVVTRLLARGANIEAQEDVADRTPLHYAVYWNWPKVVKLLLDSNADIDAQAEGGTTPLHYAAEIGQVEVVQLLLDYNADVYARDEAGGTALHKAAEYGQTEAAKLLLDGDAVIDARDDQGRTPLYLAIEQCHVDTVLLLLRRGADVSAANKKGEKPLFLAQDKSFLTRENYIGQGYSSKEAARRVLDAATILHHCVASLKVRHARDAYDLATVGRRERIASGMGNTDVTDVSLLSEPAVRGDAKRAGAVIELQEQEDKEQKDGKEEKRRLSDAEHPHHEDAKLSLSGALDSQGMTEAPLSVPSSVMPSSEGLSLGALAGIAGARRRKAAECPHPEPASEGGEKEIERSKEVSMPDGWIL